MEAKQGRLEGMQPKKFQEIEEKALEVKRFERLRIENGDKEEKARAELLDLMKDEKTTKVDLGEQEDLGEGEWEAIVKRQEPKAFVRRKRKKKSEESAKDSKKLDEAEKTEKADVA